MGVREASSEREDEEVKVRWERRVGMLDRLLRRRHLVAGRIT